MFVIKPFLYKENKTLNTTCFNSFNFDRSYIKITFESDGYFNTKIIGSNCKKLHCIYNTRNIEIINHEISLNVKKNTSIKISATEKTRKTCIKLILSTPVLKINESVDVNNDVNDTDNKILIVMPTFNRGNVIEKVIKNIQDQTFKNWILLIINDGSNEENNILYKQHESKYSNEKVIFIKNNKNRNVAYTLNKGINYFLNNESLTHFTWISDDNEYKNIYLKNLMNNTHDFTYSSYIYNINGNDTIINKEYENKIELLNKWKGCGAFMWSKEIIKKIGFYKDNIDGAEDYEFLLRTFYNTTKIKFINIPTMTYYLNEDSGFSKNTELVYKKAKEVKNIYTNLTNAEKYIPTYIQEFNNDLINKHKTRRILIFGSNGMLGRYITRLFKNKNYNVIKLTRKDYDLTNIAIESLEEMLVSKKINENDIIINCAGVIPQSSKQKNVDTSIYFKINGEFPVILGQICDKYNAKMIHITTDCVFSGKDGQYDENSIHDETNDYGKSKSAGEKGKGTIIRTSIIGEELENKRSFLEWVRSNEGGEINGFIYHHWNGVTCLELAKIMEEIVREQKFWEGVRHIFSPTTVNKYEMASMINEIYKLNIRINKHNTNKVDKSLKSIHNKIFNVPELYIQLQEISEFNLEENKKISIVMAYYNRKPQTLVTLDGFEKQYVGKYDFEVVIVDDSSNNDNRLEEDIKKYSFPINLIVISKEEKGDRVNPCTAYNKGFKEASGEIIIIQNPECYHIGDIIGNTLKNMKEEDYYSYSCFTANNEEITKEIITHNNFRELLENDEFMNRNKSIVGLNWYNHPTEPGRDVGYHFCSAIYKDKLDLIGGFDERFADGYCFDDDELLLTVKYNLRLNIKIVNTNDCFVVHQFHERNASFNCEFDKERNSVIKQKWLKNRDLYESIKQEHEKNNFEYPKLLFLYWDESPMSYLNYLTVPSFNEYNKGWKIIVFTPIHKTTEISWKTEEQKEKYTGKCHFDELKNIHNVTVMRIDLDKIGFFNNASEVIKSDYFRYYILEKYGGLWSDFDIIYTSSVEKKMNFNGNTVIFECVLKTKNNKFNYSYYPIGLFLAKRNTDFFKFIVKKTKEFYNPDEYQSIGASMFKKLFKKCEDVYKVDKNVSICDHEYYLPWGHNEICEVYDNISCEDLPKNNVGIHWFNGAKESKNFANDLDKRIKKFNMTCYFDKFIMKYIGAKNDFDLSYFKKMNKIVSIILPYYNRKDKIKITLDSYQNFYRGIHDLEIIIVDDGSSEEHKLNDIVNDYELDIKLINLPPKKSKNEVNPCYPYNVGVRNSRGNILVLSSPETFHTKNMYIETECFDKLNDESYLLLSTFCCTDKQVIKNIINNDFCLNKDTNDLFINGLGEGFLSDGKTKRPNFNNKYGSWYLHSKYKKSDLNFLTCMTRNLYYKMSGFNEKYRNGTGYDDNEFLDRIKNYVPLENFYYYDNFVGIHIDHEVVHNLPPTMNEQIYKENSLYLNNDKWGKVNNRRKKIGFFCSFGIGGADKVTQILTNSFVDNYSDMFEFLLFYNKECLPAVGSKTRINNYKKNKLIKINKTDELNNYGLDVFIVHIGGNEHWLIEDFENIVFKFKIIEINFHGDVETKCDYRICPSKEIFDKLVKSKFDKNKIFLIENPIQNKLSNDDLREELKLQNKFIYGRIARNDIEIYSCTNLLAYKQVENDNNVFLYVNPNDQAIADAEALGIKNIIFIDGSVDEEIVTKYYNTFDVLCHSNPIGETFGNTIAEAINHGKPVVSHEGYKDKNYSQSHKNFFIGCEELIIKNNINESYTYCEKEYGYHRRAIANEYAKNMKKLENNKEYYNKINEIQNSNIKRYKCDIITKKYIDTLENILRDTVYYPKIYDCFMFNNEIDILHMRLDYLYDSVDYFVICEAKVSHSRKIMKDEYNFIKNKDIFKKYLNKIIFLQLEDFPGNYNDGVKKNNKETVIWPNENFQRKYLYNGIVNANEDDIIIMSDLDEIPFISSIEKATTLLMNNCPIVCVKHDLFYYCVNLKKTQVWEGSIFFKKKELSNKLYDILLKQSENNLIDFSANSYGILNDIISFSFDSELEKTEKVINISVGIPGICGSSINENKISILSKNKDISKELYDSLIDPNAVFKLSINNEDELKKELYFKNRTNFSPQDVMQYFRNKRTNLTNINKDTIYIKGGVHYSWFGNAKNIQEKFNSIAEYDIIENFNNITNINDCITNAKDLFSRDGMYGEITQIELDKTNSLSNINKFIDLYPYFYYREKVILVNDYCKGLLGERVLWNFMLEGIPNLVPVDIDVIKTDSSIDDLDISFEDKVSKYIEKHHPKYKCIIQNGSYFSLIKSTKPRVSIIQDNLRKMNLKNDIQEHNYLNSEYIVTNSNEVDEYYDERDNYQIPLGVDNVLFNIKNKQNLIEQYNINLSNISKIGIFVGALNEVKGWSRIEKIINEHDDILWIIVSKHVDDNIKKNNVVFYTKIDQNKLCDLLNIADFFIIGSNSETQCLAAIEACLCNTPIIMKNTGFVTNLTNYEKEKIGFIGDDLENAVKKMKHQKQHFTPRDIVIKYYSIDEMNKKWIKFLDSI